MRKRIIPVVFVILVILFSCVFYVFWVYLPPMYTREAAIFDHLSRYPGLGNWNIDYTMWFVASYDVLQSKELIPKNDVLADLQSHQDEDLYAYFVSDYPQVGDAYYAVSTLAVLEELDWVNTTRYAEWLAELQEADGGVKTAPESLMGWEPKPTTLATCWAILTLKMLQRLDAVNVTKAIDWLFEECYNETDGSFRPYPSYNGTAQYGHYYGDPELLYDTSLVLQTLYEIGKIERLNTTKTTDFIFTYHNSSTGGFGAYATTVGEGNVQDTFEAVNALTLMGTIGQLDVQKTINFVLGKQQSDGHFGAPNYPNYKNDGQALATLQLFNALERLREHFPAYYNYAIWNYYLTGQNVAIAGLGIFVLIVLVASWLLIKQHKSVHDDFRIRTA